MKSEIITGDCIEAMRQMPAGSVHCIITSPPYWGLRDYGIDRQLGLEKTPDEYVAKMVKVFRAVWRVLRDDGTLWLNMGDTYAHSGPCGGSSPDGPRKPRATDAEKQRKMGYCVPPGLKSKDLIGMPWRLAFALQIDGWYLRSDIIWAKPNPMPESVMDRPTKSHEHMFLLTKKPHYYYDAEAVREAGPRYTRKAGGYTQHHKQGASRFGGKGGFSDSDVTTTGRNLRDVWNIPTESFSAAHFATFPRKLVEPCIKAGTSEKGCCPECGAPWVRVVKRNRCATRPGVNTKIKVPGGWDTAPGAHGTLHRTNRTVSEYRERAEIGNRDPGRHVTTTYTVGWEASCDCRSTQAPVPCMVLDPFAGSGTVGVLAKQLCRDFIGIELNPEYVAMAERRIANPNLEPPVRDCVGQSEMAFDAASEV